jgi:biopolymer transport protein ExbB
MSDAHGSLGLMKMLEQADALAIAVLIVLSAMSLASWFVILTRLWDQRLVAKSYAQAQSKFWTAGNPWEGMAALSGRDNVFRMLAEDGIRAALHHEGQLAEQVSLNDWIAVSLSRSIESASNRLVNGLAILATTGSVAPFVGLLGTVWGIYNALNRISLTGQTGIEQVAGPIGEALIMTAIGLFVAVPAVMGYNWLLRRNKKLQERMKQFAAELHTWLVGGKRIDTTAPLQRAAVGRALVRPGLAGAGVA